MRLAVRISAAHWNFLHNGIVHWPDRCEIQPPSETIFPSLHGATRGLEACTSISST